jgi:predicted acetyltransferase
MQREAWNDHSKLIRASSFTRFIARLSRKTTTESGHQLKTTWSPCHNDFKVNNCIKIRWKITFRICKFGIWAILPKKKKKKKKKKGIKIGLKIRKLKHLNSSLFGPISVDFNLGNRKSRKVIEEILQQIIGRS